MLRIVRIGACRNTNTLSLEFRYLKIIVLRSLSVIRVDKNEWDAFLNDFSELAKKYELLLDKLEVAKGKVASQREKTRQQGAKSSEALRQVKSAMEKLCKKTETVLNESE